MNKTHGGGASLATYIGVVRRRSTLVVLAMLVVPAVAISLSLNQQKLYQASAQVLILDQTPQSLYGTTTPTAPIDPTRRANTEIAVAEVPEVARRTLASLGIRGRSPQQLLQNTSVTAAADADILTLAVTDANPNLAARLTNQYATEFIGYQQQLNTAAVRAALQGVTARIASLRKAIATGATGDPARASELRTLLSRQQSLETEQTLQGGTLDVIQHASNAQQVQPKVMRNALAGVGLGVILGLALAFLVDALDTRVRGADEISRILGLPLLGRVATTPRRLRRSNTLAMLDARTRSHAEEYHVLRTGFDLANLKSRAKTVLVTSAGKSEGKSTTSANLAVALARSGRRVALVDLDLRDPMLERYFGLDRSPGVTGVATGVASLQEAIQSVAVSHDPVAVRADGGNGNGGGQLRVDGMLDVLPAGVVPPDPAGILATGELFAILQQLRETYDVVLIDSPPMLLVGDAMALISVVDGVVIIARAGTIRRPALMELRRLLDTAPSSKLGFVLTAADAAGSYRYGHGYGAYGEYEPGSLAAESAGVEAPPSSMRA